MLLLATVHPDPALAVVVIFGAIIGSLLAVSGASVPAGRDRQHHRR